MKTIDNGPMLAEPAKFDRLNFPLYVSVKIDGVRAIVRDGILYSRALLAIPNTYTQSLFGQDALNGLDGELVVGNPWDKNLMQQTTSGAMSEHGSPDVWFYVFDYWTEPDIPYELRLHRLMGGMNENFCNRHQRVVLLTQVLVHSLEELYAYEQSALDQGYEGVMLRKPDGRYKFGRSTAHEQHLVKVKRFEDAEAVVIGFEEQMHNANEATIDERGLTKRSSHKANMMPKGTLGALIVKDVKTGVVFNVGGGKGMTAELRQQIWDHRDSLVGQHITYYSFSQTGVKDKPRIGQFKSFRSAGDMS